MISPDKIDFARLKAGAKALNETGLVPETLRTVGVSKEALANAFCIAIEALSEEDVEKVTNDDKGDLNEIGNLYNFLIGDEVEEEAKAAEETAKPAKEKPAKVAKEKPAKEAKEAKPKKEIARGIFGSIEGSAANDIDKLLAAGTTVEEIMAKAGVTRSRVVTHVKFLEKERGIIIKKDGDKLSGTAPKK